MDGIEDVFPRGDKNDAFAQYFIGQSYLSILSKEQVVVANVTFEPGCRNNWHIHHAESVGGQILLCTTGRGYYQEWEETREGTPPRRCREHPGGSETLARCRARQLVLPHRHRGPGDRKQERMVRTRVRRGIRKTQMIISRPGPCSLPETVYPGGIRTLTATPNVLSR